MFGAKKEAQRLQEENDVLRQELERLGALDAVALAAELDRLRDEVAGLRTEKDSLHEDIVETSEQLILQEVGIYNYRHPLDDAEAYKTTLSSLQDRIKEMAKKDGGAIQAAQEWTVNNSKVEGRKMVRDISKLMLRAYNNEADNCVRTLKPYGLDAAIKRMTKAQETIAKLGRIMNISISAGYHILRIKELELTADYLQKVAEEKEAERAERERLREEATAQREFDREQAKLDKERSHYLSAIEALKAKGDAAAATEAEQKLGEIDEAMHGLADRRANIRAGYVYVISNFGSFGPDMVKIGMTRRLEPMDRVRELGDASVPFRYDVHALIFSEDAVSLETTLHDALGDQRVNLVNMKREFFYTKPGRVKELLVDLSGDLLHFVDEPEAVEWRQSLHSRPQTGEPDTASATPVLDP